MAAFTWARAIGNLCSNCLGVNILSPAPLVAFFFLPQMPLKNNHQKNLITMFLALLSMLILYIVFFCFFDLRLLFPIFISLRYDPNFSWSFFASARLIIPFFILFKKLKASSKWSKFILEMLPLYLYIKSSRLTFSFNSVMPSSLFSISSLIFFFFQITGLSSSS